MWLGLSGSAWNSRKPRGACTDPLMPPVCCRSTVSRTSTKTTFGSPARANASFAAIAVTCAFASASNCLAPRFSMASSRSVFALHAGGGQQPLLRGIQWLAVEIGLAVLNCHVADLRLTLEQLGVRRNAETLLQIDGDLDRRARHCLVERRVTAREIGRGDGIALGVHTRSIDDARGVIDMGDRVAHRRGHGDRAVGLLRGDRRGVEVRRERAMEVAGRSDGG